MVEAEASMSCVPSKMFWITAGEYTCKGLSEAEMVIISSRIRLL